MLVSPLDYIVYTPELQWIIYDNGCILQVHYFSTWWPDSRFRGHRWIPPLPEAQAEDETHLRLQKTWLELRRRRVAIHPPTVLLTYPCPAKLYFFSDLEVHLEKNLGLERARRSRDKDRDKEESRGTTPQPLHRTWLQKPLLSPLERTISFRSGWASKR